VGKNEKFKEDMSFIVEKMYKDVRIIYGNKNMEYNDNDIHIKTCEILSYLFSKIDQEYSWEFSIIYDSMEDMYKKVYNKIRRKQKWKTMKMF